MRKLGFAGVAAVLIAMPGLAFAQSNGVTSGPAAGTPTTMGSDGKSPATPHQNDALQGSSGSTSTGQLGGTPGVKPGLPDAGSGSHNAPTGQKP